MKDAPLAEQEAATDVDSQWISKLMDRVEREMKEDSKHDGEKGNYTLLTDQTIHIRSLSKVCCDGFTCGIKYTCNNQHNTLL